MVMNRRESDPFLGEAGRGSFRNADKTEADKRSQRATDWRAGNELDSSSPARAELMWEGKYDADGRRGSRCRFRRSRIARGLSGFAIHTSRKRLLSTPTVKPFVVQNLGKYERQQWAGAEFGGGGPSTALRAVPLPRVAGEERQRADVEFILKRPTRRRSTAMRGCMA
jgi:hypothetical protein